MYIGDNNKTSSNEIRIAKLFVNYKQNTFSEKDMKDPHVLAIKNVKFELVRNTSEVSSIFKPSAMYHVIECRKPKYITHI